MTVTNKLAYYTTEIITASKYISNRPTQNQTRVKEDDSDKHTSLPHHGINYCISQKSLIRIQEVDTNTLAYYIILLITGFKVKVLGKNLIRNLLNGRNLKIIIYLFFTFKVLCGAASAVGPGDPIL